MSICWNTIIPKCCIFPRCFVHGVRALKYEQIENNEVQTSFLNNSYRIVLIALGIGGFALFYFSAASMVKLLDVVTIISFMLAPFIGFINLRAIQSEAIPASHRPPSWMIIFAYIGLVAMVGFAIYYMLQL